jgi:hypothetical protein
VEGALVVAREQRERLRLKNRYFEVFAGKLANVIERVESGEGDECDLVAVETAQHIRAPEAGNASHRREQLAQEELLVRVGVLGCRPASPHAGDHSRSLTVPLERVRWRVRLSGVVCVSIGEVRALADTAQPEPDLVIEVAELIWEPIAD